MNPPMRDLRPDPDGQLWFVTDGLLIQSEQGVLAVVINDPNPVLVGSVQCLLRAELTGDGLGEVHVPYFVHFGRTGNAHVVLEDRIVVEVVLVSADKALGILGVIAAGHVFLDGGRAVGCKPVVGGAGIDAGPAHIRRSSG